MFPRTVSKNTFSRNRIDTSMSVYLSKDSIMSMLFTRAEVLIRQSGSYFFLLLTKESNPAQ